MIILHCLLNGLVSHREGPVECFNLELTFELLVEAATGDKVDFTVDDTAKVTLFQQHFGDIDLTIVHQENLSGLYKSTT